MNPRLPRIVLSALGLAMTFFAGLILGHFHSVVTPTGGVQSSEAKVQPLTKQTANESVAVKQLSVKDLAEKLLKADYGEQGKLMAGVPIAQRYATVESLMAMAGPNGLPYKLIKSIDDLINAEMMRDPDSTIHRILAIKHHANRDYLFRQALGDEKQKKWANQKFDSLLSALTSQERPNKLYCELISLLGKDSIDRVMELSKKYSIDEDGEIQFPAWVEGEALSKGWQKAFDYYKDCWKANNSSYMSSYNEIPKDFNFQAFASAWAAHEKNLNFGPKGGFYSRPTYLWQEWAKREPQAALDFFLSEGTKTFDVSDFMQGYAAVAPSIDLYTVVNQIGIERPADLNRIGFFMRERLSKNAQSQLDFADWTIKSGDLSLAAIVMTNLSGAEHVGLKQRIVSSLPADLRLGLARKIYFNESNKLGIVNHDKTTEAMTAAGYTPVEIQSLLHGVK